MQSVMIRLAVLAGLLISSAAAPLGCSSSNDAGGTPRTGDGGRAEAGTKSRDSGAPAKDARQPASDSGARDTGADHVLPDSGGPDARAADGGAPDTSAPDTGSPDTSVSDASQAADGEDGTTLMSADGFAASRQACVDKINALRASDTAVALEPLVLENTDMLNTCADTQATTDQSMEAMHYAFENSNPACSTSGVSGQTECPDGWGTSPASVEQCLQQMWDESTQADCVGCGVGCDPLFGGCPNCNFSDCEHYVLLSSPDFTKVACGFAGAAPSSNDSWSVQNFDK
jgi:hypothetical protein